MGQSGFFVLSLLTVANPLMQVTQNECLQFVTKTSVAGTASKQRGQSQPGASFSIVRSCINAISLKYADVRFTTGLSTAYCCISNNTQLNLWFCNDATTIIVVLIISLTILICEIKYVNIGAADIRGLFAESCSNARFIFVTNIDSCINTSVIKYDVGCASF